MIYRKDKCVLNFLINDMKNPILWFNFLNISIAFNEIFNHFPNYGM